MPGLIGIPNTGYVLTEFMQSMLGLITCGSQFGFLRASALHLAREWFAEDCLRKGADYICFIDTDMVVPPILIEQLLSHNLPIVSAMCFRKTEPYSPAFFEKCWFEKGIMKATGYQLDTIPDKLFEVAGVGMAAIIIRREVFENTPRPWFAPYPYAGEDVSFCMRAREAGYKIYIDPSMIIGHIGQNVGDIFAYLKHKREQENLAGGSV